MKCDAVRRQYAETAAEGDRAWAPRALREHVESCAACRDYVAEFDALMGLLDQAVTPWQETIDVSPDFDAKLAARIAAEPDQAPAPSPAAPWRDALRRWSARLLPGGPAADFGIGRRVWVGAAAALALVATVSLVRQAHHPSAAPAPTLSAHALPAPALGTAPGRTSSTPASPALAPTVERMATATSSPAAGTTHTTGTVEMAANRQQPRLGPAFAHGAGIVGDLQALDQDHDLLANSNLISGDNTGQGNDDAEPTSDSPAHAPAQ